MARFDKAMAERDEKENEVKTEAGIKTEPPQTNGHDTTTATASPERTSASTPADTPQSPPSSTKHKHESDEEELSEVIDSPKPKKKRKVEPDSDAAYAARLQAMENSRMRSTRGGGPKAAKPVKKKTPKKKSAGKVKAEDDSELEGSGSEVKEKKVNRNTGFHVSLNSVLPDSELIVSQKELMLSTPLSALLDNEVKVSVFLFAAMFSHIHYILNPHQLSRPQTVKRIWEYVRAHDLQDPKDKRMILCDEGMRAVFKQDKVHMFTMNKILNQNLYAMDE